MSKFNELIGRHKLEYTNDAQATDNEKTMVGVKTNQSVTAKKREQMGI